MAAKTFYDILKGNPYHDERGRFTTAPNARNPMIRTDPPPKNTKIAYKVFVARDGKLYPPMVANPDGMDTPVGVWLDAAEGTKATDKDGNPITNTLGRNKVKAGGKGTQGGSGTLAYRPGWHLGELPEAKQFYTKDKVTGEKMQKKNFVWAECEIAADFDYQAEAMSYGYNKNGKFQHSLAGLPKIPKDGYYTYRTNPDPTTQPWYITGSMKVNRILTDKETNAILRSHGIEPMKRDGGELDLKALGFTETNFVKKSNDEKESFSIFKTDDDKRLVFGWASISITVEGEQLEDRQKDMIDPEDLEEAAYEYVLNFRDTGEEHVSTMRKKGKLVESCVFTAEKQKAIGIPEGTLPIGWWIGFKIEDDAAWERVKNGTYKMFSIEGKANRVPVEKSRKDYDEYPEYGMWLEENLDATRDEQKAAEEHYRKQKKVAKTFDEILKFNPYHDERGRFASSSGYSQFTIRTRDPKKQYMADMAIAREKERAAAAAANPTNDPNVIAGVKRGQAMTHEQADEGRANPEHAKIDAAQRKLNEARRKWDEAVDRNASLEEKEQARAEITKCTEEYNKVYDEYRPYKINCQTCVVAYEARRRGYDVEAIGRTRQNQSQETLARKMESAWVDPATGEHPKPLVNDPKIRTAKQAQKWLEANVEPGGRYELSHGWKGTDGRTGHIVTISRNDSGSLRIFDPQTGKSFEGEGFTNYISGIKSTYSIQQYNPSKRSNWESVPQGRLQLLRVDNLQISAQMANAVLKGAR